MVEASVCSREKVSFGVVADESDGKGNFRNGYSDIDIGR